QRVELADSWQWARTGDELFARPDLDLWLADDLAGDRDVGVVVRHRLPEDPREAAALIRLLPPRPHEVFPARIADVRMLLTRVLSEPDARTSEESVPVLRVRGDDVEALAAPPEDLRPGDVLVLDDRVELLRGGVVYAEGQERADDVLELGPAALDGSRGAAHVRELVEGRARGRVLLRLGASSLLDPADAGAEAGRITDLLAWVAAAEEEGVTLPRRQELATRLDKLADALAEADERRLPVLAAAQLLRGRAKDVDIHVHRDRDGTTEGAVDRVVVLDVRRAAADEDLRQTWTPAADPVPLARHREAVGARAADLARRLGVGDTLAETLFVAGLRHDDGKADPRFQELLGGVPSDAVLAKSGRRSPREDRAARQSCSLPPGWRHEQLSALSAWQALADRAAPQRALAIRLVATSHGHGRAGFPHTGAELLGGGADPDARTLFDEGEWEALVEATDRRHGVWGVAYLEALLRAADGVVSREGS
ncbi:MAG TPA: hypothetical protein VKP11_08190, partial [Frankiaceae bacterium]|nr:hypothetical protein [Frankiaceae bacterium]